MDYVWIYFLKSIFQNLYYLELKVTALNAAIFDNFHLDSLQSRPHLHNRQKVQSSQSETLAIHRIIKQSLT